MRRFREREAVRIRNEQAAQEFWRALDLTGWKMLIYRLRMGRLKDCMKSSLFPWMRMKLLT